MEDREVKKPTVFINAAMSLDGKISSVEREQIRISDEEDLERVDRLRAEADAIVVGGKTLRSDNPGLSVRSERLRLERRRNGLRVDPIKVVVTGSGKVPLDSSFIREGEGPKFVFTTERADREAIETLSGVSSVYVVGRKNVNFDRMLDILAGHGVERVMVEGGATLNFEMIRARVVDEIHVTISPCIIGGKSAPTLVDGVGFTEGGVKTLDLISCEERGGSVLLKYRVQYGDNDVGEVRRTTRRQFDLKESRS